MNETIPMNELIEALCDGNSILPPRYLYRFSDMVDSEIALLQSEWEKIPVWRRQALMEDLEELGGNDDLLSFEAIARLALQDVEPATRLSAVRTLWDYEDREIGDIFSELLKHDQDANVRAAAANGLGKFVYAGELEDLPESIHNRIVTLLLDVAQGSDTLLVRRRALESLGYSERAEIPGLIERAYKNKEKEWIASAVAAMGHSADHQWDANIIESLESQHPIIRVEAARASGELAIKKAVPRLLDMLDDPDLNSRDASIWALSLIGGSGVRTRLERLLSQADEDEVDFIQEALEMLSFTEETSLFPLIDLDDLEEDNYDEE